MSTISSGHSLPSSHPWEGRLRTRLPAGIPNEIRKTIYKARRLLDSLERADSPIRKKDISQEIDVIMTSITKYQKSITRGDARYGFLTNFCHKCRQELFKIKTAQAEVKQKETHSPKKTAPNKRQNVPPPPETPDVVMAEPIEVAPPIPPAPVVLAPPPPMPPAMKMPRIAPPPRIKPAPIQPIQQKLAEIPENTNVETSEYLSLLQCLREVATPEIAHRSIERCLLFIETSDSVEHIASIEAWAATQPPNPELSLLLGRCQKAKERAFFIETIQKFIKEVGQGKTPLAEMRAFAEANKTLFSFETPSKIFQALYEKVAAEAQRRETQAFLLAEIAAFPNSEKIQAAFNACATRQELYEVKNAYEKVLQYFPPDVSIEEIQAIFAQKEQEFDIEDKFFKELLDKKIPEAAARGIAHGMKNGWKDLFGLVDGIPVQLHGIQGLKIYHDQEGRLCADYGLEALGEGGRKRAKEFTRIWLSGETKQLVRATKKQKDLDPAEAAKIFAEEKAFETGIRRDLAEAGERLENPKISNSALQSVVLWLWEGEPYFDSHGNKKIRLFSEKATGDLKIFMKKQWLKPEDIKAIFIASKDVLQAEVGLHERGLVHNDIKPDNIFLFGEHALVADFGEAGKIGAPFSKDKGTSAYLPPAVSAGIITTNDPQTDVYAFGIMLFMTLGIQLGYDLARINEEFREYCLHEKDQGKKMERYGQVISEIQEIQRQVSALPEKPLRTRAFWQWAATLIDPIQRPTSSQAMEQFASYVASLGIVTTNKHII